MEKKTLLHKNSWYLGLICEEWKGIKLANQASVDALVIDITEKASNRQVNMFHQCLPPFETMAIKIKTLIILQIC